MVLIRFHDAVAAKRDMKWVCGCGSGIMLALFAVGEILSHSQNCQMLVTAIESENLLIVSVGFLTGATACSGPVFESGRPE